MDERLLDLLRCPYCGTRLSIVDNDALVRVGSRIESGVLGCECCAFPVVASIPVLIADDATRDAMHAMEAGRGEEAFCSLLGLDRAGASAFLALLGRGQDATYQDALAILSRDAEGTCFFYRLTDPTYVMAEALLQAIGQRPEIAAGRYLDICGGSGHLTRVLTGLRPAGGTVVADLFFWKLWLARRFVSPNAVPVCCDANHPLPFTRSAFSLVSLADAFPYIWHKRLLAEEMMRLAEEGGAVVLPHLHSALSENFSAGDTLTPAAYRDLFAPGHPRLFSDERLLTGVLEDREVDLTRDATPGEIGTEPSLTLVASARAELFRRYDVPDASDVTGELKVNPLYRVEHRDGSSILRLTFPTPEYEEEFDACRRYLPETVTINADLTGPIRPAMLGDDYGELRRRRIIVDAPSRYY